MSSRGFFFALSMTVLSMTMGAVASAAGPSNAQEHGAEQFLAAVATGNFQAVAQELHPEEVEKLRSRLLELLRAEASRSDSTYKSRLFGPGRSLKELESMTPVRFFGALSERLSVRGRVYENYDWLAAVPDGKVVYLVGRGKQPKERGSVQVVVIVALRQYGAQWRAVVPSEIEARIDDLIEGRATGGPGQGGATAVVVPKTPLSPGISELLARAEASLAAGQCEEYYAEFMSPNFQKATSRSARKTLVTACMNSESTRETMITTLRIVQELSPRYDLGGSRAIYDVSGQGLPYERFVLEREKDRWYIAE